MSGGFFKDNLTSDSDLLEEQARDAADRAEAARDRAETAETSAQAIAASSNASAVAAAASSTASLAAQTAAETAQAAAELAESGAQTLKNETFSLTESSTLLYQNTLTAKNSAAYSATQAQTAQGLAETAQAAAETAETAAETAQAAAETAATNLETALASSESARDAAQAAQAAAETAETNAETAETNALSSAGTATAQAGIATTKAAEAASSATDAETAQTASETAQAAAETAQGLAETAQTASETAQTAAETAQGLAETAQTAAETAETAAELAETNAETAQGLAESARDASQSAQSAAETAEANAATSEFNASTSASNAATSETNASTSASTATAQAGIATTKASEAASSATDAQTAQTAAESAQSATEDLFDQFGDQYLGSKASDPTTDNDGDPLNSGDVYWNTSNNTLRFYNGTAWVAPETIATTAATNALTAQTAAETAETNAGTSETNAAASATSAAGSATGSATAAAAAGSSASAASGWATAASGSATSASASKTAAAGSATAASGSATAAAASETNAAASASTASAAATTANTHKNSSAVSATAASNSATAASGSATSASGSATSASTSATNAAASELAAATSETNASTSATAASTAQTAAETARDEAVAAQEAIDGIYLGNNNNNPTVDLNGDPVTVGDWYFNTTDNTTRIYDGSAWNTITPDLIGDTTPQLGGDLDTNGNDIKFGDNDKATFGAGDDLQIYHDGSDSIIKDAGTGNLDITTNGVAIRLVQGNGNRLVTAGYGTAGVKLWYGSDDSERLATTSTGIDVSGTVTADGLTVDGDVLFDKTASGANKVLINASGGNNSRLVFCEGALAGEKYNIGFNSSDASFNVYHSAGAANRLKLQNNGDLSFYSDDGTSEDFYWDASTSRLGLGTTSPGADIHVSKAVPNIRWADSGASGVNQIYQSGSSFVLDADPTNADANSRIIFKVDTSEAARIDSSGRLGIGTTAPDSLFHISSGGPKITITDTTYNADATITVNDAGSLTFSADANNERTNSRIQFDVDGSEAARIDSSGNLLVGTTNSTLYNSTSDTGIAQLPLGKIEIARSGGTLLTLNRLASDGTIAEFRKDGSTVGSILSKGNGTNLAIVFRTEDNTDGCGIIGSGIGNGRILPADGNGDGIDNHIDLGTPTARWKNIYLSNDVISDGSVTSNVSINAETGTTYTTVLTDRSKLVTLDNASAVTVTIPPNSSVAYPTGTKIDLLAKGAGQVTVAAGTGVTVNSSQTLKLRAQWSAASVVKLATDTWVLLGDLEAS